ncbi:unnamed protein product [Calypogeia fissa]
MGDRSMGMGSFSVSEDVTLHHVFRILADAPSSSSPNGIGSNFTAKFNPSMAIIIIVLISAFLFMGFFSIYVRRCTRNTGSSNLDAARQAQRDAVSTRQAQGLDKSVVEALPLVGYSLVKGLKGGKDISECAVCLSEFEDDENLRLLPKCGHIFHPDCIDMWFHSHSTCPLCRSSLVPVDGKEVEGEEHSHSEEEEFQNWVSSRGVGPDGEAFTIHEGPPVPPNGSILELLSREGAERILAESVRITGERADRLDAGLARREGEDENADRAAGIRALNRALSRNSASFRNVARGLDASGRIDAVNSTSGRFNSTSVSINIPDPNDSVDTEKSSGSKSFGSSRSFNMALRRSSSVGSSGRYIKQLLGMQGYSGFSPDEFGLNRARLLNAKQELPIVNPIVRRERSASELRNITIPAWQDIDLNAPISGGGVGGGERGAANGTAIPTATTSTTRPGVLPFERWASRSRKFWSGELIGSNNYDAKRMDPSGLAESASGGPLYMRRNEKEPVIEERTKSDRWSSIGQSFRNTFSLKRTTSSPSDVESSSLPQPQGGPSIASKSKKFSPWAGAMKIRRQASNPGDLPSPHSPSSMPFPQSFSTGDFPQSFPVDSPRSLPSDSTGFPQPLPVSYEQRQQQLQHQQPPKEDSTRSEA